MSSTCRGPWPSPPAASCPWTIRASAPGRKPATMPPLRLSARAALRRRWPVCRCAPPPSTMGAWCPAASEKPDSGSAVAGTARTPMNQGQAPRRTATAPADGRGSWGLDGSRDASAAIGMRASFSRLPEKAWREERKRAPLNDGARKCPRPHGLLEAGVTPARCLQAAARPSLEPPHEQCRGIPDGEVQYRCYRVDREVLIVAGRDDLAGEHELLNGHDGAPGPYP